jgi:hypothetical protein
VVAQLESFMLLVFWQRSHVNFDLVKPFAGEPFLVPRKMSLYTSSALREAASFHQLKVFLFSFGLRSQALRE